jgi:surface polysaccharide O-acyltransferase-like enzyme
LASQHIQSLRGLACLLLVAFHVIGSEATSGMRVEDDSIYRLFGNLMVHIRMPLFTFLSGYVYAWRPVLPGRATEFARRKVTRLLVPLLVASTIYFLVTLIVPDSHGRIELASVWRIWVFPYVHFWFLQAIIAIFAAVAVLEHFGALATRTRYGAVLLSAFALNLTVPLDFPTFFSLSKAAYLSPFFLLGVGANRFNEIFVNPGTIWACSTAFVLTMCIHAAAVLAPAGDFAARGTLLGTTISATGALALWYWFPQIWTLARLGVYAFTIYLYHPLFAGATLKALQFLGMTSDATLFVCALSAGLIGPIVLERIA